MSNDSHFNKSTYVKENNLAIKFSKESETEQQVKICYLQSSSPAVFQYSGNNASNLVSASYQSEMLPLDSGPSNNFSRKSPLLTELDNKNKSVFQYDCYSANNGQPSKCNYEVLSNSVTDPRTGDASNLSGPEETIRISSSIFQVSNPTENEPALSKSRTDMGCSFTNNTASSILSLDPWQLSIDNKNISASYNEQVGFYLAVFLLFSNVILCIFLISITKFNIN